MRRLSTLLRIIKSSLSNRSEVITSKSKIWTEDDIKRLPLFKRFVLKIRGYIFLRYEKRGSWEKYLPIYLVHCNIHDIYFEDYPHGYSGRFDCPLCLKERWGDLG